MDHPQSNPESQAVEAPASLVAKVLQEAGKEIQCRYNVETQETDWYRDIGSILLGYAPETIRPVMQMLPEFMFPESRAGFAQNWKNLIENGSGEFEICLRKEDKTPRRCWLKGVRISDTPWIAISIRDVHTILEDRDAYSDIRSKQAVETMAAGVSHEFNNHLTPVRGFIELALDEIEEASPVYTDLKVALKQVDHCKDLIEHIQSYGGKVMLSPRMTEISALTASLVRSAVTLEKGHKQVETEEFTDGRIPHIKLDHASFRKATTHIVRNAIAAIGNRGGRLRIRIETVPDAPVRDPHPHGYVRISFEDNGHGMEPETLRRIRDPFFTTHGRALARGMGIPMVQGMVQQHGGCLDISSAPDQGSKVSLYLPIPQESLAMDHEDDDGMAVMQAASVGQVLIADDEDVIRRLIGRVFSGEGWLTQEANDFHEVLRAVESDPSLFSLIILDVTMPGPVAEEVVGRIRAMGCKANIMIVTGLALDERLEALVQMGGGGFMQKPFSPTALLTAVDEIMTDKDT